MGVGCVVTGPNKEVTTRGDEEREGEGAGRVLVCGPEGGVSEAESRETPVQSQEEAWMQVGALDFVEWADVFGED